MLSIFFSHNKSLDIGHPRFGLMAAHHGALSVFRLDFRSDSPSHGSETAVGSFKHRVLQLQSTNARERRRLYVAVFLCQEEKSFAEPAAYLPVPTSRGLRKHLFNMEWKFSVIG